MVKFEFAALLCCTIFLSYVLSFRIFNNNIGMRVLHNNRVFMMDSPEDEGTQSQVQYFDVRNKMVGPMPLIPKILNKFKQSFATCLAIVAITLHLPAPTFAKQKSVKSGSEVVAAARKKTNKGSKAKFQKGDKNSDTSALKGSSKNGKISAGSSKTKIEVQIQKPSFAGNDLDRNKQLTQVGLIMIAGSVVGSVIFGGKSANNKPNLNPVLAESSFSTTVTEEKPKRPTLKSMDTLASPLKPVPMRANIPTVSKSMKRPIIEMKGDEEVKAVENVKEVSTGKETHPEVESASILAPTPVEQLSSPPTPLAPKPSAPEKKGIFSRLFPPAVSRPTSIAAALAVHDGAAPYRQAVASSLWHLLPETARSTMSASAPPQLLGGAAESGEQLAARWSSLALSTAEAAEAFADVASAVLVTLMDSALQQLDGAKERAKAKKDATAATEAGDNASSSPPDPFAQAVDDVVALVKAAGGLFPSAVAADATLSTPVQYNGAAKKGRLEDLYVEYAKIGVFQLGVGGIEAAGEKSDLLAQALGLKSGRREALDQRVMREMMMSLGSGDGGFNMGDMMGAFKDGVGGIPGMAGKGVPSLGDIDPTFKDMSPEQLKQFSTEAFQAVKQGLQDGAITREEVLELEKVMGQKIEFLVDMLKQMEKAGTKGGEALGGDFNEMLGIFNGLLEIKKK